MLRTKMAELLIHGLQTAGVELGFEAKMADTALEFEHLQFGVGQHGGEEMGGACVARVLVGALPIEAFCLSDLCYSSTFHRLW